MTMCNTTQSLIQSFQQAGQGQVFRYFEQLDANEQENLLAQARTVDLDEVAALVAEHITDSHDSAIDLDSLEPAPYIALPSNGGDAAQWAAAHQAGAEAIAAGRVAAFTVAGGQGT